MQERVSLIVRIIPNLIRRVFARVVDHHVRLVRLIPHSYVKAAKTVIIYTKTRALKPVPLVLTRIPPL